MTDHCIIKADFCNFRPVAGRKVLQLYFEVPMEEGDEALRRLGGMPQPGSSRWCAIALLNEQNNPSEGLSKAKLPTSPDVGGSPVIQAEGGSHKKAWSDYTRSQQAAILCADPAFGDYFLKPDDPTDVVTRLRHHFRISSRSELDKPENHARWDEFVALYNLHRDRLK